MWTETHGPVRACWLPVQPETMSKKNKANGNRVRYHASSPDLWANAYMSVFVHYTHIHACTHTPNLLSLFSVAHVCTCLEETSCNLLLAKTDSSSFSIHWFPAALHWQMGVCELSPIQTWHVSGAVIIWVLFSKTHCCFMGVSSLSCLEDTTS